MNVISVCFFRAFDVELLYIAQQLKIPLVEVAINWKEIDGLFSVFFFSQYQPVSIPYNPLSRHNKQ